MLAVLAIDIQIESFQIDIIKKIEIFRFLSNTFFKEFNDDTSLRNQLGEKYRNSVDLEISVTLDYSIRNSTK